MCVPPEGGAGESGGPGASAFHAGRVCRSPAGCTPGGQCNARHPPICALGAWPRSQLDPGSSGDARWVHENDCWNPRAEKLLPRKGPAAGCALSKAGFAQCTGRTSDASGLRACIARVSTPVHVTAPDPPALRTSVGCVGVRAAGLPSSNGKLAVRMACSPLTLICVWGCRSIALGSAEHPITETSSGIKVE